MQIIELVASYGPWSWMVAGLVLLALELVVPGGFFLWLGISGLVTGVAGLRSRHLAADPVGDLRRARARHACCCGGAIRATTGR